MKKLNDKLNQWHNDLQLLALSGDEFKQFLLDNATKENTEWINLQSVKTLKQSLLLGIIGEMQFEFDLLPIMPNESHITL